MQASSNSKSSSEEDLLELSEETRKKHFLDYDYDHLPNNNKVSAARTPELKSAKVSSPAENGINTHNGVTANNNNCAHSLDLKKKVLERPSTSKVITMDQLNANAKSGNVDSVYSILSMCGSIDSSDVASKFLELSKSREICAKLRPGGGITLLVQMIHSESSDEACQKMCLQALHNIIHCHHDDKAGRREARVLKLIEQLFDYFDALRSIMRNELSDNVDRHPIQAIGTLMKISFDEEHRHAMCQLGALQTISTLIQLDHAVHGPVSTETNCILMRRYAGMCLTNLTFGDGNNKALLCYNKKFMRALVDQVNSKNDELVPVTASIIRNLSWRADAHMKEVLNEIGAVKILTLTAMKCSQENTLKQILSALWNLSNHCAKSKAEFCEIDGAIEFLVDMLSYEAASKTTSVIENAGGILRNVSSHIALHEELRVILRRKNCFSLLLQQLKSPSLTCVSNSCGTLGNLSAHCAEDQKFLRDNGAIPMLRSLIYSKHKMISTGSTIALRNLLACKANVTHNENLDSVAKKMDLKELPTLNVRKQRALQNELILTTKSDDISPSTKDDKTKDLSGPSKDKFNIEDEDEDSPTNFSKFEDDQEDAEPSEFQEGNHDQITDYSIRYGDNSAEEAKKRANITSADDTTKCYYTEGTPHAGLSGSTSMTDLRKDKIKETVRLAEDKKSKEEEASGIQSPEKTVNYCVEGTPGNFSRSDSLSDLDEGVMLGAKGDKAGPSKTRSGAKVPAPLMIRKDCSAEKESIAATPKSVTFGSLAEETPLMFSRTSSLGSLDSAEPACFDDKSSVVSDFSRLASGIISPSELPDSPTQSVPQSPSRLHARVHQKPIAASRTPPILSTREVIGAEAAEDCTNTFQVENTPAVYSYATSLSNLSFDDEPKISTDAISKEFQLMKHPSIEDEDQKIISNEENLPSQPPDIAELSDVESADDDILLESCINMGMNKALNPPKDVAKLANNSGSSISKDQHLDIATRPVPLKFDPQTVKENPIDMMRAGAPLLPPYLPVDEFNRFIVEDSPCNFSMMSGLSAITMESNMNTTQQVVNKPTAKVEPTVRHEEGAGPSRNPVRLSSRQEFEESLSSLSMESEDDANLFSQVIAAGVNKIVKTEGSVPINIPAKPRPSAEMCNESISSVDSCGKDDASNSILEQCIQMGINKVVKKESSKHRDHVVITSSPKRSMLPKPNVKPGTSKVDKEQEKRDEELLQECIATGILRNTRTGHIPLNQNFEQMSISEPKNAETTSVIAMDNQLASTITGVEAKAEEINKIKSQSMPVSSSDFSFKCSENRARDENTASRSELSRQGSWTMPSGSSSTGFDLNLSLGSVDDNILERSNEYPAAKLSMGAYGEFDDDSIMEMSNEFLVDNERMSEARIEDKHKDPDLMMKSVDRLTQALVSQAEYLRKNTNSDENSIEQKMSGSFNNTWTDENSFPSISLSAPMIGSTNDETTFATDQICSIPEERILPNIVDDKTPTNEHYTFTTNGDDIDGPSPKIEFKVGGELNTQSLNNKANFVSFGPMSIETSSTMSNSTIVQVEAKRIAHKLNSMTSRLMDSTTSLDLENVRPPSSMDCISLNSYQDSSIQQSPLRQPKKSLITGLVAKRALGHPIISASVESINSIFNIESIRPPSIMDELLDSMISVDSIVSEAVDPTMMGISNYETALSDMEDSLTLRSCQDLSKDETLTGTSSDFSSVESTPKKKRNSRSLTPKQKRQSDKDRYKTYTIQVDMLLKAQQEQKANSSTESMRRSLNARQRRQEDRQRFETQVISRSTNQTAVGREASEIDDDLSILAMTQNFEFLRSRVATRNGNNIDTSGIRNKLNRIKSGDASSSLTRQTEDSLEYERQTSETESQRDLKNSLNYDANSSVEQEESPASTPSQPETPKIKTPKSSYISPYRMTTRVNPMKNKAVKVTKGATIAKVVNRNSTVELKSTPNSAIKANLAKSRYTGIKSAPSKTTNIPKPATTPTQSKEPPSMPIRQGTFIQDEPTLENVPVVNDVSPAKTAVSKIKPPSRVPSSSKIPTEKIPSPKKASNLPASVSQLKYRSNSNASMKNPIPGPIRSNTGINLNNPKKIVTSKIAGIWKSGEKKESLLKKPISTSSGQLNIGAKHSTPVSRKLVSSGGKDRIKRSSTCDEIV